MYPHDPHLFSGLFVTICALADNVNTGYADRSKHTRLRISDEGDRSFRDRDRRFRQRDRAFRERDRADRKAGLALRMTSTTRVMLVGFCRREHARAPDEHAHDQGRFTTY